MHLKDHPVEPGPALSLKAGGALLVVDVQVDFLAGGPLAVPRGDEVVPVLNDYLTLFLQAGLPVLATRDWHLGKHLSLQAQGGPWPVHCVAGTAGASVASGLRRLFIGGLATDYCVLKTVLDALALGYQTLLLQDAIRAVEVQPGDGQRALAQMLQQGAQTVTLQQIRVTS